MNELKKLTINTSDIKDVASKLEPILKNGLETTPKILFRVEDKVTAYATNGESYIKVTFNCENEGKGEFAISGEQFIGIVKNTSGKKIDLSLTDDSKLLIVADSIKYKIALIEGDTKYLIAPEMADTKSFEISAQDLCSAISAVSCCIDQGKAHLNCVMIHSDEKNKDKVCIVSTDCMRLGIAERKAVSSSDVIPNLLIPNQAAGYINSIANKSKENLLIKYTENTIQVSINEICYTAKLLDGSFPKYQSVIPDNKKVLEVKTSDFKEIIKKTAAISSNTSRIEMTLNKDKIDILCSDSITGDNSNASIEATFSDKSEMKIVCNHKMLQDILDKISSNIVRILITDGNTPMVIRSVDDESVKYIFMPLVAN